MRNSQVRERVDECVQTLELVECLNQGGTVDFVHHIPTQEFLESFKFKIYTEKTVVSGHSFGGATTVKAVMSASGTQKSKFKFGVAFDSWMLPIRDEIEDLTKANPSEERQLFFLNYEKFQWPKNLINMGKFQQTIG